MQTTTLEVQAPDGPMAVYEAKPDQPTRSAVIVIQEAFGVTDYIEDVTRRFADLGYYALAPHIFHRAGGGTAPYDDWEKVFPLFSGLTDQGILDDVDAALGVIREQGIDDSRVGIVGFCFGGRVTFLVSLHRSIGAASGFYGGGIVTTRFDGFPALIERSAELQTPWLGLFGDLDPSIPIEDVERLRGVLAGVAIDTDVVRYPHGDHGFHRDIGEHYEPAAAKDAWERTLGWFADHDVSP
jgi:carboxymethylenebutenolidase